MGIHVPCSQDWAVQGQLCQVPLQVIKGLQVTVASIFGWHIAHCQKCCPLIWQEQTCSKLQDDVSAIISHLPLLNMLSYAISNKDRNASPWRPPPCLLGFGPWLANAVISLQVGHCLVKLAGMRFCEQNEGWVFCSKHSKCIMLVVAGQAAMHVSTARFCIDVASHGPRTPSRRRPQGQSQGRPLCGAT